MEGIAQCINNNITTIVAHPTGRSKESVTQPEYLVAQFQYNKSDDTYTCPQGEILKPREDGKAVELSKAVISSRNTEHPLAKLSSKPFMHQ
jgi:hypothetical protein